MIVQTTGLEDIRMNVKKGLRLSGLIARLALSITGLGWLSLSTLRTSLFIVVKTERSTSQQSVTQDSDYIASAYIVTCLSRRTATSDTTVTQDSHNNQVQPEGCQKQTAPRLCQHPIRWAFTLQALARWRHRAYIQLNGHVSHLSTSEGWKAELA